MVTTMSDVQAATASAEDRALWWDLARRPRRPGQVAKRWYAENTREPIRDETFRVWKEYGALLEDALPTTSSLPRYRLAPDFAELFNPDLDGADLDDAIAAWQSRHLTSAARMRMALVRQESSSAVGDQVRFPDGATRLFAIGPSTPLLKAAVERFATAFLSRPVVLVVTESRRRLAYEDSEQLARVRLSPDPRVMPDLLLADVGTPRGELQLTFLECVATGGAMTHERAGALQEWLRRCGHGGTKAAFGSIFSDRAAPVFRQLAGQLAWGSFVWFASEPGNIVVFLERERFHPTFTLDGLMTTRDGTQDSSAWRPGIGEASFTPP
jgi:hypothetical protein